MESVVKIFGSPQRYYQGSGALDLLPRICAEVGGMPAVVIDEDVLGIVGERLRALLEDMPHILLPFSSEVTVPEMETLASAAREAGAGLIVGIGGGKALDAAKGVALRCGLRFISI
jgi:glycerol dehydrogenase